MRITRAALDGAARCSWRIRGRVAGESQRTASAQRSPPPALTVAQRAAVSTPINVSLYAHPRLYDVAFYTDRDVAAETSWLVSAAARAIDRAPRSLLELGCGPARHALEASRLGLFAAGLDCSPAMLEYAGRLAGRHERELLLLEGDFTRPSSSPQRFDVVACLLGTLSHVVTNADVHRCFSAVANTMLTSDGVFIAELPHPRHNFDGSIVKAARRAAEEEEEEDDEEASWLVPTWDAVDGECRLTVAWGAPGDVFDAMSSVLHRTVTVDVMSDAAGGLAGSVISDVVPTRLFTMPELELLSAGAGLQVAASYGALGDVAVDNDSADRLVVVFRRSPIPTIMDDRQK